jgi:hypothetical protein
MKRAQILIADVWACFNGEAYGAFADIDTITMFADYRVPQVCSQFPPGVGDALASPSTAECSDGPPQDSPQTNKHTGSVTTY